MLKPCQPTIFSMVIVYLALPVVVMLIVEGFVILCHLCHWHTHGDNTAHIIINRFIKGMCVPILQSHAQRSVRLTLIASSWFTRLVRAMTSVWSAVVFSKKRPATKAPTINKNAPIHSSQKKVDIFMRFNFDFRLFL